MDQNPFLVGVYLLAMVGAVALIQDELPPPQLKGIFDSILEAQPGGKNALYKHVEETATRIMQTGAL